jgi:hypothetical protein
MPWPQEHGPVPRLNFPHKTSRSRGYWRTRLDLALDRETVNEQVSTEPGGENGGVRLLVRGAHREIDLAIAPADLTGTGKRQ